MKDNVKNTPDLIKAKRRSSAPTHFIYPDLKYTSDMLAFLSGKKFYIHTYGCQANVRDEETMRGLLDGVNMTSTDNPNEADVIIINTCAVRENAEDKVYGEIGNLKHLRQKNKDLVLAICGCMIEQPEILERVMNTFKEVNLIFGTHEIYQLVFLLVEVMRNKTRIIAVESKEGEVIEVNPVIRNNPYKAYVNIMYGCDKFCTYCIVPYTRGKERSRRFLDVKKETEELFNQGYQEVTFLGQNVNAYGKDLDEGYDFADVLEMAAKIGIPRIRFTTSHPWDFTDKMIDVIAKYPNIMKFIHLPVQSGSSEILKLMGRRYTREDYLALVKKMRERIPGLTLSTDIIVGFPNETEEQFNETLTLVDEVKYEAAFTFIYSPRRGTPAARMEDKVSYEDKSRRFQNLVKHLEIHIERDAKAQVGKSLLVLVDGPSKNDPEMYSGYTENNKLVHFKATPNDIGKIIPVKILESHTYSLIGEIVKDEIIEATLELKEALKDREEYKEYIRLKSLYEQSEEIKELIIKINNSKAGSDEYNSLMEEYNNHPLVSNYKQAEEEYRALLRNISTIIGK